MGTARSTCVLLACVLLLAGCAITMGSFEPNAHFIPPNSNVTSLGPVRGSAKGFLIMGFGPGLTIEHVRDAHRQAIEQQSGANALINYSQSFTATDFGYFTMVTYVVEAEAVRVEVGEQPLE